jgi:uncharacterized membrane protein
MSLHAIVYLLLVVVILILLWASAMAWMELRSPSAQARTRAGERLPRDTRRRVGPGSESNSPAAESVERLRPVRRSPPRTAANRSGKLSLRP